MFRPVTLAVLFASTALAQGAAAAVFTTVSATNVVSNGGSQSSTSAGTLSYVFSGLSGAYTLKTINFSGTVEKVASGDLASEKRIGMTAAGGYTSVLNTASIFSPYSGTPAQSTLSNKLWDVPDLTVANNTRLNFQFWESANDGGDSGIDGIYRALSLALDGDPYAGTAPTVTGAYGTLSGNGLAASKPGSIFSSGQVNWYSFTLDKNVGGAGGYKYLDLDTNIPGNTALDTEIALYDSAGHLIVEDDEDGTNFKSALSFGAGSGRALNPGETIPVISAGQDGNLAAGTYYLAVAPYNATFGTDAWVVNGGASSGGYNANVTLGAVPEPTSLALLGTIGLVVRRRRAK